jgi:uncharacterized repeat protein (TIGR01451 family)
MIRRLPTRRALVLVTSAVALACVAMPASAVVALGVELNPSPARAGETIRGQLTVANNGPGNAIGVTLRATMPAGLEAINPNLMSVFPTATRAARRRTATRATS